MIHILDAHIKITDSSGYIHSIDNVVYTYYITRYNLQKVAKELVEIRTEHNASGWEKLNCSSCSKYSFYQNVIHIDSIHISFGKYHEYDRKLKQWIILPMLRLEVNPAKHADKAIFKSIMKWIRENCTEGTLRKFDYAIDIPFPINSVRVLGSRKEAGLYKGTIYRGQRSQHGFMKIYDKGKEQSENITLTRIEHTLDAGKPLSLEKIIILTQNTLSVNSDNLDNLNRCIVDLCLLVYAHGVDFEPYISKLNYRRRKTIEPYLYGGNNIVELEYDTSIIQNLLNNTSKLFNADTSANEKTLLADANGFIQIPDDYELPFLE